MPRRETPFLPDQYYHFYNRGNNRQAVFFEPENYVYFLRGIKKYLFGFVEILAYCLMPTHYHILVRVLRTQTSQTSQTSEVLKTSEVSNVEVSKQVSLAMQRFLISYTKAINKRFDRTGALFQGQFQAKPITTYKHLLTLCAYIHANPVKDGLAASPEMWDFSNYLEWMGLRNGTLVNREFIAENFGTAEEYRKFVAEYIHNRRVDEEFQKYIQDFE
jgi:REP element-mobilizing transposase RayT